MNKEFVFNKKINLSYEIIDNTPGIEYLLTHLDLLSFLSQCLKNTFKILYNDSADGPRIDNLRLSFKKFNRITLHTMENNSCTVIINSDYIDRLPKNQYLIQEICGIIQFKIANITQWINPTVPHNYNIAISDFIRLVSGFPASNWQKEQPIPTPIEPTYGAPTCYFFKWLNNTYPGFISKLNTRIQSISFNNNDLLEEITGSKLAVLWKTYQNTLTPQPPSKPISDLTPISPIGNNSSLQFNIGTSTFTVNCIIEDDSLDGVKKLKEIMDPTLLLKFCVYTVISILFDSPIGMRYYTVHFKIKNDNGVAYTLGNTIVLNTNYIQRAFSSRNIESFRKEIIGVMVHEMTHVFQFSNRQMPGGFVEGIADYVRLVSGYSEGTEKKTNGPFVPGYGPPTSYFFKWLNTNHNQFIKKLNQSAKNGWDINEFSKSITHKTLDELWNIYQQSL